MSTDRLRRSLRGRLALPNEPDFGARVDALAWNTLPPSGAATFPRPAMIASVADAADVQTCVRFAREAGLRVSVRSGGHHWSGIAIGDGTLQLDLSALRAADIDANRRIARVQPAVTNRQLAQQLGSQGLAFSYGHCPSVALGGYLLGGGFGWNCRRWGRACAGVDGADVVTADGELLQVTAREHSELFDGLRGGGPLFPGVVTRYSLRLQTLPRAIRNRTLDYPSAAAAALGVWMDSLELAPDVELVCIVSPRDGESACTVSATAFADDDVQARAMLAPLEEGRCPAGHTSRSGPMATDFDGIFDVGATLYPAAHRCLADSFWLDGGADTVLPKVASMLAVAPSPLSHALVFPTEAAQHVGVHATPGGTYVLCYAIWRDAADDEANRRWFDDVTKDLAASATGHYVGETTLLGRDGARRLRGSYSEVGWNRLLDLRRRYDPGGVFALRVPA